MAQVDPSGRSAMIPNAEGDLLTPSIVLFGDTEVVVGKSARTAAAVAPDQVAEWVKRDMGQPSYNHAIHGKLLPPEVIQACILRKLKAESVDRMGPSAAVVITVPAYFDEPRRKATADAGQMAGLNVLDIVNEPTAAALAFGESIGYLSRAGGPREEMTVLVYDLGGGTFDATLLKLAPGDIRTIATDGDVQLGGHDWDERLVNYVAEEFLREHNVDPREDAGSLNRLYAAVVEAKHALTARSHTTARIDFAGRSADVAITREKFEELTADLLERTAYTTRQLVVDAKMQFSDLTRVLLVGGSTRMPMVAQMLAQATGVAPERTVNPDEAVARGAALYASYLIAKGAQGGSQAKFEVTNVNAHSLGMEGIDQETLRKTNVVLIPRNTPLPVKRTERFVTKTENQRSIVLKVLEGESSLPGECTAIGRTVIRDIPSGLPKGWPIEVTFEYGTNSRLNVRAMVPGTHQEAKLSLERSVGLSNEGIARWTRPVVSSAGFDAFEEMVQDVLEVPAGGKAAEAVEATIGVDPVAVAADAEPPLETAPVQAASSQQPAAVAGPALTTGGRARPDAQSPARRAAVMLIGYVTSALVGLGMGYLVLAWLRPNTFPLPW
ncbi:MAG: Hsp70 family protein [Candidatus Nealsonbacteria bacterium]|nr:Hsp70 family protein [Candidatus Nealsonbacteria bacterium]